MAASTFLVTPGTGEVHPFECPFCGTGGIKFEAVVCKGCQADIKYTDVERSKDNQTGLIALAAATVSGGALAWLADVLLDNAALAGAAFLLCFAMTFIGVIKLMQEQEVGEDWSSQPTIVQFSRGGKTLILTGVSMPVDF